MNTIIIASKNKGKLAELEAPLKDLGFTVKLLPDDYPDIVEDGNSFEENALIKAHFVCNDTGLPALADDSGICVDALQGGPGIFSARYARNYHDLDKMPEQGQNVITKKESQDEKNIRKLLDQMQGITGKHRSCAFHCAMALVFPKQNDIQDNTIMNTKRAQNTITPLCKEIVVHEKWEGILLNAPQGDKGFGYDPIFFDEELLCSAAQLSKEVKMERSHRGKALRALFVEIAKRNHSIKTYDNSTM